GPQPNMLSLQHAQQLRQSAGVKPAPDFDSAVARQCHRQTALPRRAGARHLHRQPTAPGYWTALHVPLPIAGQRGQAQPLLPAELNLTHAAGFVFGHQPLGFRATPTSLDFHYLRFFVHPSTASPMPAREQMGCSDAYTQECGSGSRRLAPWATIFRLTGSAFDAACQKGRNSRTPAGWPAEAGLDARPTL